MYAFFQHRHRAPSVKRVIAKNDENLRSAGDEREKSGTLADCFSQMYSQTMKKIYRSRYR